MDITKEIYDRLENHRFLKFDDEQKVWQTLRPLAVRDKIGHALRFSNRKGQGSASARKKIRRTISGSSQSTFDSCDSGWDSSFRSNTMSPLPNAEYSEMVQLAAQMDIHRTSNGSTKDIEEMSSYCRTSGRLPPSLVSIPTSNDDGVLDYRTLDKESDDDDLAWILQIPLLEVNPETNKIYFVQQQSS